MKSRFYENSKYLLWKQDPTSSVMILIRWRADWISSRFLALTTSEFKQFQSVFYQASNYWMKQGNSNGIHASQLNSNLSKMTHHSAYSPYNGRQMQTTSYRMIHLRNGHFHSLHFYSQSITKDIYEPDSSFLVVLLEETWYFSQSSQKFIIIYWYNYHSMWLNLIKLAGISSNHNNWPRVTIL